MMTKHSCIIISTIVFNYFLSKIFNYDRTKRVKGKLRTKTKRNITPRHIYTRIIIKQN